MKKYNLLVCAAAALIAAMMCASAFAHPPDAAPAVTSVQADAQKNVTQSGAFALHSAYDDGSCDAKPAPMKPGKAPGKGGGKKKCISASVPLDDGYLLAGKSGKKAKGKKPKSTA